MAVADVERGRQVFAGVIVIEVDAILVGVEATIDHETAQIDPRHEIGLPARRLAVEVETHAGIGTAGHDVIARTEQQIAVATQAHADTRRKRIQRVCHRRRCHQQQHQRDRYTAHQSIFAWPCHADLGNHHHITGL